MLTLLQSMNVMIVLIARPRVMIWRCLSPEIIFRFVVLYLEKTYNISVRYNISLLLSIHGWNWNNKTNPHLLMLFKMLLVLFSRTLGTVLCTPFLYKLYTSLSRIHEKYVSSLVLDISPSSRALLLITTLQFVFTRPYN